MYIDNFQCKHIVLGCCHDTGYVPFLEQFAANDSICERITLLQGGTIERGIATLGFKRTLRLGTVFGSDEANDFVVATPPYLPTTPSSLVSKPPYINPEIDSERLGPVLRNEEGQRIDKKLFVTDASVKAVRSGRLCHWFYLRGECTGCPRLHTLPPLDLKTYNAVWFISRQALCNKIRKGKDCDDPKCIYGHREY